MYSQSLFFFNAKIGKLSVKTNLYTGKYRMKKDDFRQLRKNFTIFRCHIPILQRVGYISLFAFYHFKFFSLLPYLICWCQDFISFFHFSEAFSSSLKKHLFVQSEMYLRLRWNFLVFCVKCTYVSLWMHLRLEAVFCLVITAKSFIMSGEYI